MEVDTQVLVVEESGFTFTEVPERPTGRKVTATARHRRCLETIPVLEGCLSP